MNIRSGALAAMALCCWSLQGISGNTAVVAATAATAPVAAGVAVVSPAPAAPAASVAELGNGRRVLLERGLQIQALGFVDSVAAPVDYRLWKSAHFTAFNSWNDTDPLRKLGWAVPWGRWMRVDLSNPLTEDEKRNAASLVCLQFDDELNQDKKPATTGTLNAVKLEKIAAAFAGWRESIGSDFIAYTNFGANNAYGKKRMTPAGLAAYMRATQPDMLMFDAYPTNYPKTVPFEVWYGEMQKYRLAGLAGIDGSGRQPLPYAQYTDLYRTSYEQALPPESYVRLQEFAGWAFGYTFLTAFVYNKPKDPLVYPALFAGAGDSRPTEVFGYVAEANRQSLNLGPALVRLTSSDVRMIPGTNAGTIQGTTLTESLNGSLPEGIAAWGRGAGGNEYIVSITPVASQGGGASATYNDIIIGYFEPLLSDNDDYPFAGGTHFMIVNGSHTGTAAAGAQWYRIVFDFGASGFDSLQRLSRETGEVETVPLTHISGTQYSLDLHLEGGTGDLFRFWSLRAGKR